MTKKLTKKQEAARLKAEVKAQKALNKWLAAEIEGFEKNFKTPFTESSGFDLI